jgi:hypothetical protein
VGALTYGDWPAAQDDRGRAIARAFFAALPAADDEARATSPMIRLWRQLG